MKIINRIKKWWNRSDRRYQYRYLNHLRTLQDEHFKFIIYYKDPLDNKRKIHTYFRTFPRREQSWSHVGNALAFNTITLTKQWGHQTYNKKNHIGFMLKPEDIIDVRFEKVDKHYNKIKGII
jgi:hypothetical protein